MELASMLAGEPFSDHPRAVSPAVAAFLRNYNDLLDDERRQDLYEYAGRSVGSARPIEVEAARCARLLGWGDALWEARARRSLLARLRSRTARERRAIAPEPAARYAIHAIPKVTEEIHEAALKLVDELIEIGSSRPPTPAAASPLSGGTLTASPL
jgi:hypothetical protein